MSLKGNANEMLLNYNQGTTVVDMNPANMQSFLRGAPPKTFSGGAATGGGGSGLYYHFVFRAAAAGADGFAPPGAEAKERFYRFITGCVKVLGGGAEAVGGSRRGDSAESVHLLVSLDKSQNPAEFVRRLKLLTASWARRNLNLRDFAWQPDEEVFTVSQSQCNYLSQSIRRQGASFS